jgi:hypothetical protein
MKSYLFDLTGKLLLHRSIKMLETPLDIRHLTKGVYLFRVTDREGVRTGRLIKE